MPATFNIPTQQVIPGQLIASALWNGEFKNIYDNFTPGGLDDYSNTLVEMQVQTDPYPGSVIALPNSFAQETERIRFVLAGTKGTTYWYEPPVKTIAQLNTLALGHTHTGGADGTQLPPTGLADGAVTTPKIADANVTYAKMAPGVIIPSGSVTVFHQASAPVGFTKLTSQDDKALRVVSGVGGGSGGSYAVSSGHSHTVNAHSHTISHTHTYSGTTGGSSTQQVTDAGANALTTNPSHTHSYSGSTSDVATPPSGLSGNTAPGTDSPVMAYIDVILCSKD